MRRGNLFVEQVDREGNYVMDYDTSLSVSEIYETIRTWFPGIYKDSDGMICGEYRGAKYAIRAKNVTYLGNPHPCYKKRIQIPDDFPFFCAKARERGMTPILLGVYTYGSEVLFCDFYTEDFVGKKAHNSSAHVYTEDLSAAMTDQYFQKIDFFGNRITVFRPDIVNLFLEELLGFGENVSEMEVPGIGTSETAQAECPGRVPGTGSRVEYAFETAKVQMPQKTPSQETSGALPEIIDHVRAFFDQEERIWYGAECYRKMIRDSYRNKFQPEWAGFYLEYEFENYLRDHVSDSLIRYAQDKREGGIDLDLYFERLGCYGDLKAHSETSPGIQENDWDTVMGILRRESPHDHIYYIVCEHDTVKDSEHGFEVTHFWNRAKGKINLMSYSGKMKHHVTLKKAYILDIHPGNQKYLSVFKQGINSNGKPRPPKIMINHDDLKHFVIFEMTL